jgi:thiamine pyrophosphate-dependent acetolactate synthase large subunit-like protein
MTIMTGGHAVVRQLIAEGVETVFAVPGLQIMDIYDARKGARGMVEGVFSIRLEDTAGALCQDV